MKRFIKLKEDKGFTLVELLIVMAIIAVLIGISIAGLGFAMRRSRNISRSAAMANLERALAAYYSDDQDYPGATASDAAFPALISTTLDSYLEGSWEAPPETTLVYGYDQSSVTYVICVSQEESGGAVGAVCTGPGIGAANYPGQTSFESTDLSTPDPDGIAALFGVAVISGGCVEDAGADPVTGVCD